MFKKVISIFFLSVAFIGVTNAYASTDDTFKPKNFYRADTYTDKFAERFNLPKLPKEDQPTGGAQLIEFYAEPDGNRKMMCFLRLYVDSDLKIQFPEKGESGNIKNYVPENTLLQKSGKINKSDREYFTKKSGAYIGIFNNVTSSETKDYSKILYKTLHFWNFQKEPFPGLNYFSVKSYDCLASSKLATHPYARLEIRRQPDPYGNNDNFGNPYKFPLPQTFLKQIVAITSNFKEPFDNNRYYDVVYIKNNK